MPGAHARIGSPPNRAPQRSDPFQILQGCALLSQVHATLTQDWLGIKPDAVLGVSSGETNAMFATGAWHDMDAMFAEIDRVRHVHARDRRRVSGRSSAPGRIATPGRSSGPAGACWRRWPRSRPRWQGEEFAYLTMINAPADCLVAGQAAACRACRRQDRAPSLRGERERDHRPSSGREELGTGVARHSSPRDTACRRRALLFQRTRRRLHAGSRKRVADALTDQATGWRRFPPRGRRGLGRRRAHLCRTWAAQCLQRLDSQHSGRARASRRGAGPAAEWRRAVARRRGTAGGRRRRRRLSGARSLRWRAPACSADPPHAPRRVLSFPAHYPPVVLPLPAPQRRRRLAVH